MARTSSRENGSAGRPNRVYCPRRTSGSDELVNSRPLSEQVAHFCFPVSVHNIRTASPLYIVGLHGDIFRQARSYISVVVLWRSCTWHSSPMAERFHCCHGIGSWIDAA